MGFSFRKSIKIVPGIKLNISKKGLGISAGVKGARISTGPRGVNIYGGAGSIRFQKQLMNANGKNSLSNQNIPSLSFTSHSLNVLPPPKAYSWKYFWGCFFVWSALLLLAFSGYVASLVTFIISGFFFRWGKRKYDEYVEKAVGYKKFCDIRKEIESSELSIEKLQEVEMILLDAYKSYPKLGIKYLLGTLQFQNNEYEKSFLIFQEISILIPTSSFKLLVSKNLINLGRYDDALSALPEEDQIEDPDELMEWFELMGRAYMGLLQHDKCEDVLKRGLARRSEVYTEGKRKLKIVEVENLIIMNETQKAKTKLVKILQENPSNCIAQELLNRIEDKIKKVS